MRVVFLLAFSCLGILRNNDLRSMVRVASEKTRTVQAEDAVVAGPILKHLFPQHPNPEMQCAKKSECAPTAEDELSALSISVDNLPEGSEYFLTARHKNWKSDKKSKSTCGTIQKLGETLKFDDWECSLAKEDKEGCKGPCGPIEVTVYRNTNEGGLEIGFAKLDFQPMDFAAKKIVVNVVKLQLNKRLKYEDMPTQTTGKIIEVTGDLREAPERNISKVRKLMKEHCRKIAIISIIILFFITVRVCTGGPSESEYPIVGGLADAKYEEASPGPAPTQGLSDWFGSSSPPSTGTTTTIVETAVVTVATPPGSSGAAIFSKSPVQEAPPKSEMPAVQEEEIIAMVPKPEKDPDKKFDNYEVGK